MVDRLFLDFDGTLIDSGPRLYALFVDLAPEFHLSYEAYWRIKKDGMSQSAILRDRLGYSDRQIRSFQAEWMRLVEDPQRLLADRPFDGVTAFLERSALCWELYLVTARQNPDRVRSQISRFGWDAHFSNVFVTEQRQSKASLISANLSCRSTDVIIGDSEEDINSGRELGVRTIAVSSGALSAEALTRLGPDAVIGSVTDFDLGS